METIYIYNGASRLTIPVTDSAERSHSLQQHNYVKLVWKSAENTPISANAYIEYEGQVFYALDDYFPTHKDGIYEYDIEFHAIEDTFNRPLFFRHVEVTDQATQKKTTWKEVEWSLNGNLKTIADIVITCLNRAYDNAYFELPTDSYTDTILMSYSFSGSSIADALSTIAEQNETEWWLETTTEYVGGKRKYILHFDKCELGDTIELNDNYTEDANGVWQSGGLKSVSQSGNTNIIPQKLYVYGSERNIIKKTVEEQVEGGVMNVSYDKKLRLPKLFSSDITGANGAIYENKTLGLTITLNEDSSLSIGGINNHFEQVKIFDEVYPKMDMEVTAVSVQNPNSENPIYWLKGDRLTSITDEAPADNSINPGKLGLLIEGCTLMCTFTSGLLNGREFECAWRESSAEIGLIPIDENDVQIPSGVFKPQEGDTFILWNLAMPQSSIEIAQNELCVEAINYIEELATSITETDCTTEAEATRMSGLNTKIKVGQRISVDSKVFRNGRLSSRIIKFSYKLTKPYDISFTLASSRQTGRLATLENMIADVTHEVHATGQVQRAISRRQWHDTEEMMQMLDSIQKQLVVVGDENNAFVTSCNVEYSNRTKRLSVTKGYLQHQSYTDNAWKGAWLIDKDVEIDINELDEEGTTPFYVYFVCSKAEGVGYVDVGSALPQYNDYYVFVLGILSSEFEGERIFNQSSGLTTIAGGTITTDVVQDPARRLIIDYSNATITARNGAIIKGAIQFEKGEGENDLGTAIEDLLSGVQGAQQGVEDVQEYANNIRFGGLNLIGRVSMKAQNTSYFINTVATEKLFEEEVRQVTKVAGGTPPIVALYPINDKIKAGVPYVASVYIKNSSDVASNDQYFARIIFRNVSRGSNITDVQVTDKCNNWSQIYTTYTFEEQDLDDDIGIYVYPNTGAKGTTYASCLKLQEGNRPTEGFEATTNDIAEVETKAKEVSTALTETQNTLANSLEDGYIDKDEQVRLKDVLSALDGEFNELTKEYKDVVNNQYLIDNSDLQEAYDALNTAHTNYKNIINTLLGISVTTYKVKISNFSYKDNLESKVTAYYQALPTLVNALAQAQSAIQAQLDKNAQEYANNIQVGGVNLVPFNDIMLWNGTQIRNRPTITITANSSYQGGIYLFDDNVKLNTDYVLSFKLKKVSGNILYLGGYLGTATIEMYVDGVLKTGTFGNGISFPNDTNEHSVVIKFKQSAAAGEGKLFIQPNRAHFQYAYSCVFSDIQLEQGTKATSYKPNDADRIEARENILKDVMVFDRPIASNNTTYTRIYTSEALKPNTEYVFSIESIVLKTGSATPTDISIMFWTSGANNAPINISYSAKKMSAVVTTPSHVNEKTQFFLYAGKHQATQGVGYMAFGVKLAKGNVYTGWEATPSEQQALIAISKAMDGTTDIIGGLMLTNLIGMKNSAGVIKAGVSGLTENNNLRFWAGSTAWENANVAPFRVYENGEVHAGNFFGFNGAFEINSSNFKQVCEYINSAYIWATIKYELTGANIYLGDFTAIKEELGNSMICFVFPSKANYVGSTITYFNPFGYAIGSGNDVLPYSICNTNNFMNTLSPETSLSGVGSINKGITDANGNYYRWSLVFSSVPYQIPTAWCQMIAMPIKVVSGTQIPSEFKEFIISGTYSGSLVSPYLTATTDCVILRWMFKYLNYK